MEKDEEEEPITSALSIEIPDFSMKYVNQKSVTFYLIIITNNIIHKKWSVYRRYSEFDHFYKNLEIIVSNIPPLPGKSVFKLTSFESLTKRRLALQDFLRSCSNRKDICSTEFYKKFLEIDKYSPELAYNQVERYSHSIEFPLGLRDFIYLPEEKLIFLACSEMKISSRLDAYFANSTVKAGLDNIDSEHISVGGIIVFGMTYSKINTSYMLDKKWAKSFPEQIGSINFDLEKSLLQIGLDSGTIFIYRTSDITNYYNYEKLCAIKPHVSRIMGLAFDSINGNLFSCSSDRKFIMTNLYEKELKHVEINESEGQFTNLFYDKINKRIFLTNDFGYVYIYTYKSDVPLLVKTIKTHTNNCIRGLNVDLKKGYLFTGTNKGDISLIDLLVPGKENLINEISYFGGNQEIRVIRYNPKKNEIYTGEQSGKITVWNLKTGQSIYSWKPHYEAITQMYFDVDNNLLITAGKDKLLQFWKIPDEWGNKEVLYFENNEIKNYNDTIAMIKLQKSLKREEDDSSEDSLTGWDLKE